MFTRAIVRPPAANFADGLTSVDLGEPDHSLALEQYAAYCRALADCGLKLRHLAADERYPDSTFVEDTAVLTKAGAVITRPGAGSRVGEIEEIRGVLLDYYPRVSEIYEPGTLDGGDICEAGDKFFIGVSHRTNQHGAAQLAGILSAFGYDATLIDIRGLSNILHLKSGLAYLGGNRMLVIDGLKRLKPFSDYELLDVDSAEAYAANCLPVNERVLVAAGFPKLEAGLQKLGYETIALEMSEFQKMDGGLSCLSLRF